VRLIILSNHNNDGILSSTLLQAFIENGIPENPQMAVALMRKVWTTRVVCFLCIVFVLSIEYNIA